MPQDLPPEVRDRETARLQQQISQVADDCRQALRSGLAELVGHLVERLTPDSSGKTKRLNATAVENLREFLATVSDRDITGDAEIRALGEKAKAVLGDAKADDLRGSGELSANIRAGLADVATAAEKLITVDGERKIDLDILE